MKKIFNYFLQGLLYITPIAATLFVIYWTFTTIDNIIPFDFPGLGIIVIVVLITLIGYLGSTIVFSPIRSFVYKVLQKSPILKTIYTSVQDLMSTFVGKKNGFSKPVLVKLYENSTIERIGFVTNEDMNSLHFAEGKVLVYLPHSFAFSGQLFVVEKSYITPVHLPSAEIMKLIISAGVTSIEEENNQINP